MRTIVAGSRTVDYHDVVNAIENCGWIPTVIISGHANGADKAGEKYAEEKDIPIEIYHPDWIRYRKSAGFIRNSKMVSVAEAGIFVWDGKSKGTIHCCKEATRKGLKVYLTQAEPKKKVVREKAITS